MVHCVHKQPCDCKAYPNTHRNRCAGSCNLNVVFLNGCRLKAQIPCSIYRRSRKHRFGQMCVGLRLVASADLATRNTDAHRPAGRADAAADRRRDSRNARFRRGRRRREEIHIPMTRQRSLLCGCSRDGWPRTNGFKPRIGGFGSGLNLNEVCGIRPCPRHGACPKLRERRSR